MDYDDDYPSNDKKILDVTDQATQDALDLADMGLESAMARSFNIWSMLAFSFCVLGTWSTFAQDLASGLTNGGSIAILWGLVLVTFCSLCLAISLGEMCSAMPTALGQAYWVHRLLEGDAGRLLSYICAWINVFGWWTITASQIAFMSDFILGMKVLFNNEWESTSWEEFVVYIGVTALFTAVNAVACRKEKVLPWFNNIVGIQFGTLFLVFSLALLIAVGVRSNLSYRSADFVFGTWINQTGWSDGVTWFTGLIQAAYGLTAFDSVIHMVEEIPNPRVNAPRVIWLAVAAGAVTGFIFMVVCLFCIQDLDLILDSPTGFPFMQLVLDAVGLQGAAVLLSLFIFNGLGQGVSVMTTASRLTWGFARDGGLPWSRYFSHVSPTWKVPLRVLIGQGVIIGLIGILYLFSNTVLEAILSVSTIALTISYALPVVALLIAGRGALPRGGKFSLGPRIGPIVNWVSIIYSAITTVFFFFPGEPNPAPADMNYAIAVFGIMVIIATVFWFVKGRKTYAKTEEAQLEFFRAQRLERGLEPHIVGVDISTEQK
ncbi:putative amino acid permease family protein [Xylogone sp. PMI_703]|nr:putative amino acid permease family protein [Xylogone sp. PMI_703]